MAIFDLYLFNLFFLDVILYYVSASHKLQVLSTDEEKKLAFRDVHDSNHGAHIGLNNTRVKLKSAFYWLGKGFLICFSLSILGKKSLSLH